MNTNDFLVCMDMLQSASFLTTTSEILFLLPLNIPNSELLASKTSGAYAIEYRDTLKSPSPRRSHCIAFCLRWLSLSVPEAAVVPILLRQPQPADTSIPL